jgi:hypothetical protein
MKSSLLFSTAVFLVATGVPGAGAMSDANPPQVLSILISPTVVDTSTNSQPILLTVRLTDDLSGFTAPGPAQPSFAGATATFSSPVGGAQSQTRSVSFSPYARASGNELDGIYTNTLLLPPFSRAGTWRLTQFTVSDAVGNRRQLSLAQLRSLGFPTEFTVQGTEDLAAPEILSASIIPSTVDTSSSGQLVTITVHLRDVVAGMDAPAGPMGYTVSSIGFTSPSRQQFASASFGPWNRASGDAYDGIYTNTIWVPQYSEPGDWYLQQLLLIDAAGNQRSIDLAEALSRGLPTQITVQGAGDTSPPDLRALDFSPRRIDTSSASQTILISLRLVDSLSGMGNYPSGYGGYGYASAGFLSPSRGQTASAYFGPWTRSSGTDADGVYTNTITLPRFSETGVWALQSLSLKDVVGNTTNLMPADLQRLGFPTQFAVGINPALKISRSGESLLLSWPAWAASYPLQSEQDPGQPQTWAPVGLTPVIVGEDAFVVVPISGNRVFYRLIGPP